MKKKQDILFDCTLEDLQDMCDNNQRAKQTLLGNIAEYKLGKILKNNPNIEYLKNANTMTETGDFILGYSGVSIILESKILKNAKTKEIKIIECSDCPNGVLYKGVTKLHYTTPRQHILPNGEKLITDKMYIKNIDILSCGFYNPEKKNWEFIFINSFNLPRLMGHNQKNSKILDDILPEYSYLFFAPYPTIQFPPRDGWSYDLNEILEKHVEYVKNNSPVIVPQKENKQFTLFD